MFELSRNVKFFCSDELFSTYRQKAPQYTINQFFLALICFGNRSPMTYCDEFDGSTNSATATFSSTFSHRQGGLGYFDGFPTSVGSGPRYTETDGNQKTEMLREDGWYTLGWSDHPG